MSMSHTLPLMGRASTTRLNGRRCSLLLAIFYISVQFQLPNRFAHFSLTQHDRNIKYLPTTNISNNYNLTPGS